jgi:CTP-dependent riboflavin kinase
VSSVLLRGIYKSGCGHSKYRPKLYETLGLWPGTINIQLPVETDERFLLPTERVPGRDPIDSEQDFLIRACKLKGIIGLQMLPIDKTTGHPRGHHSSKTIEVSLSRKIDLRLGEELEVELQGFSPPDPIYSESVA